MQAIPDSPHSKCALCPKGSASYQPCGNLLCNKAKYRAPSSDNWEDKPARLSDGTRFGLLFLVSAGSSGAAAIALVMAFWRVLANDIFERLKTFYNLAMQLELGDRGSCRYRRSIRGIALHWDLCSVVLGWRRPLGPPHSARVRPVRSPLCRRTRASAELDSAGICSYLAGRRTAPHQSDTGRPSRLTALPPVRRTVLLVRAWVG